MRRALALSIALVALAANLFAPQRVLSYLPCCESISSTCRTCDRASAPIHGETAFSPEKPCCKPLTQESKTRLTFVLPPSAKHDIANVVATLPALTRFEYSEDFFRYNVAPSTSPPRRYDLLSLHSRLNI
jgi:hypothetical protein